MVATSTLRQRLKPGMEFSYGELCKALGEEKKTGNSQVSQLKDWEQYINFTRKGRVYTILDVYTHPHIDPKNLPPTPRPARNSKTSEKYAYLLQGYLKDEIYNETIFTPMQLYKGLGLLDIPSPYSDSLKDLLKTKNGNQHISDENYTEVYKMIRRYARKKFDNFKSTTWYKGYFTCEGIYCGVREGAKETFDIKAEIPDLFEWMREAYLVKVVLNKREKKSSCEKTQDEIDGIVSFSSLPKDVPFTEGNPFVDFLSHKLNLKRCFMAIKIRQIRELPANPTWNEMDARKYIREYMSDCYKREIRKNFPYLKEDSIDCYVSQILPKLDAMESSSEKPLWTNLYESSDFTENCGWQQRQGIQ